MSDAVYTIQDAPLTTWRTLRYYRGENGRTNAVEDAKAFSSTVPLRVVEVLNSGMGLREVWLNEAAQAKAQKRSRNYQYREGT